jgi:nitroreductase
MVEFADVVMSRRMTRAYRSDPLPEGMLERLVTLANRAPSAGKTQGWHAVALEGEQTATFWGITLPPMRRGSFKWQGLLDAPVILLPFADPKAYVDRYAEPDKAATGLGAGPDAWPAPYWTIDSSMAVMTLLLAAEDAGLGALFFGVFKGERQLRRTLGVPSGLQLLGAVALGYAADAAGVAPAGRSASRPGRTAEQIIHRGGWTGSVRPEPAGRPGSPDRPAPDDR